MITWDEALARLRREAGDERRVAHSLLVAHLMARLAERLQADQSLWELVGLLHDLDLTTTKADLTRHGVLSAQWLEDVLPPAATHAIAAHDYRTGVRDETLLARALRAADVLAILGSRFTVQGLRDVTQQGDGAYEALMSMVEEGHYLRQAMVNLKELREVRLPEMLEMLRREIHHDASRS